ncbi:MAG: SMP-30/gluconolactonase/LRE family protein [Thermodesulfobacteriota bacterium]
MGRTGRMVETIFSARHIRLYPCWVVALGCICIGACGFREPLPIYRYDQNCYAVEVAVGPEDFVLDHWNRPPRLLVSSYDRRTGPARGDIYSFDIKTGYVRRMERTGEPSKLVGFKPHGMDIRRVGSDTFLYIIIHDPCLHGAREENAIGIYRVTAESLEFVELLEAPEHLWSPNDLSVMENGEIYVTNDYQNIMAVYLSMRTSDIVHYRPTEREWSVVASDIAFANGILAGKDKVFVAATRGDCILEFPRFDDGRLGNGRELLKLKGPDNIMAYGKYLLVAAHFNDFAFLTHSGDKKTKAPSVVFLIDPSDREPGKSMDAIYVDNGTQISAASTACIYGNKLYVSQVFDSHMVVCEAGELPAVNASPSGH